MSINQIQRLDGAESALHAARIQCRAQLAPVGLDQQGRRECRSPFVADEFEPTVLPSDTDGYGFEAAYSRPVPRWERAALRVIEQMTPVRVALAVVYVAGLAVAYAVTSGGWK